jgi:hypothetical protein
MRATTSAPSLLSNYLNQKSDDDDGGEDAEKVLIWRRRKNLLQMMMFLMCGGVFLFLLFDLFASASASRFSLLAHSKSETKTTHLGNKKCSNDSSYILNRESNERV